MTSAVTKVTKWNLSRQLIYVIYSLVYFVIILNLFKLICVMTVVVLAICETTREFIIHSINSQ